MYKISLLSFILAATLVSMNDAAFTEVQKSQVYSKLLTSGLDCLKDFPLNPEHVMIFRTKKLPDDEVAKCFISCVYKHLGLMDESGKISQENAREATKRMFKDDDDVATKIDELIGKCVHVNDKETTDGDKGCDRAKYAFECFIENAAEFGLDMQL